MATVLFADDDPDIRALVRVVLEGGGHDPIEACDGAQALAQARAARPHLILLDVMMPGLSGFDVCRAVRADPALARIPVILISGMMVTEHDRQLGYAAGADGYFLKPFSPQELLDGVDRALAHREQVSRVGAPPRRV